jgi:uncharacterized protein
MSIITIELIARIKAQYRLEWYGTHGIKHWNRVFNNGMILAEQEGVNVRVIQHFSIFHDACRRNEHLDKNHGKRGADLARELRKHCPLDDSEFGLLTTACELHTSALNHENITVQACFDSDRLDLGRVGVFPDKNRLCTPLAKEQKTIEWAYHRSINDYRLPYQPFGLASLE